MAWILCRCHSGCTLLWGHRVSIGSSNHFQPELVGLFCNLCTNTVPQPLWNEMTWIWCQCCARHNRFWAHCVTMNSEQCAVVVGIAGRRKPFQRWENVSYRMLPCKLILLFWLKSACSFFQWLPSTHTRLYLHLSKLQLIISPAASVFQLEQK